MAAGDVTGQDRQEEKTTGGGEDRMEDTRPHIVYILLAPHPLTASPSPFSSKTLASARAHRRNGRRNMFACSSGRRRLSLRYLPCLSLLYSFSGSKCCRVACLPHPSHHHPALPRHPALPPPYPAIPDGRTATLPEQYLCDISHLHCRRAALLTFCRFGGVWHVSTTCCALLRGACSAD